MQPRSYSILPEHYEAVSALIAADAFRMACLTALRSMALPQGYIGAGFLRNAIWDALHNKAFATPLNDVDVIYFCPNSTQSQDKHIEAELARLMPDVNWQVKNQARMHLLHGHEPYASCEEAISYWVERETCVAIKLNDNDKLELLAPFGLTSSFEGSLSINPMHGRPDVFRARVEAKQWLTQWPKLRLEKETF
ncbi:hypothetical protein KUL42_23000 [Alteromonas sp. KUL42]|uniref:nucleotidyltransferase family protein n=1 Tax=Alteromonas sp. KUL42 TaxID=2480797 RepID=UPI0010FFB933|nr:nucleotidyltransferase family protein [Alteromonas sp. KUL42]GEA07539.1 hypothetical protein KUL42_23000 [Alteromonas sp. KUL42]